MNLQIIFETIKSSYKREGEMDMNEIFVLTQVPPRRGEPSNKATFLPNRAARRLHPKPPEPPPITKRSYASAEDILLTSPGAKLRSERGQANKAVQEKERNASFQFESAMAIKNPALYFL